MFILFCRLSTYSAVLVNSNLTCSCLKERWNWNWTKQLIKAVETEQLVPAFFCLKIWPLQVWAGAEGTLVLQVHKGCSSMCVCSECTVCNIHIHATFAHVLCHDVDGLLWHHGVQLHQLVVPQLLHDLSLFQEGLWRHSPGLQGLHSHLSGAIPCAWNTQPGLDVTCCPLLSLP